MDPCALSDQQLVDRIEAESPVAAEVIDEYYRRCIPIYRDFLGIHWHTGFYLDEDAGVSSRDQVRMVDHIARSAGIAGGDRVLDVGCGIGATLCHLAEAYGCEAVGITPVSEQARLARELARARQVSIRVDVARAEALPYPDESFDVVTIFESSCHFEDRQAFFDEAARILKPGGRLAGEDWMATDLSDGARVSEWIDPICKTWAIPMLGDSLEYARLMESAGLVDIETLDMRSVMALERGFTVTPAALAELDREIEACANPLLALTLRGLGYLGRAMAEGAFTIGRFRARKPSADRE